MKLLVKLWFAILVITHFATCKRPHLLDSVMKKACEIVTETLFDSSNIEEKAKILKNVEEKWNIFSPTVEVDTQFMNLVIYALKVMVARDDYRLCTNISEESKDLLLKKFNITVSSPTKQFKTKTTNSDNKKELMLKEMIQKIDALVSKALKNSTSNADRQRTIDLIKKRIEEAFKRKEKPKKSMGKNFYGEIISQGIDMMADKSFKRLVKTTSVKREKSLVEARKRNEAVMGGIQNLVLKPAQVKPPNFKPVMENNIDNSIEKDVTDNNNLPELFTPGPIIGLTKEYDCTEVIANTCAKLKDVSEFKCESDDVVIGVQQFCDGIVDCADGSDEANCVKHAVHKIHAATNIVAEIDLAKNCYEEPMGKSMLPYQGDVLSQLLKKQIAFIEKYTRDKTRRTVLKNSHYSDILEVVTEVVAIVKSFSLSLKTALCTDINKEVEKIINDGDKLLDAETIPIIKTVHEMLSDCDCNNQFCTNPSCSMPCKRICFQTYSLSRWACKPVKGGAGVALDDLCDGKNDCYDETDESNCIPDHYDADRIYEEVLKKSKTLSMSKQFEPVRSRLISLHSAVRQLQKHSKGLNNNNMLYKMERDNIFSMLTDIYLDLVEEYNSMDRAEQAYDLLISLNEKLVRALKRSYTGNEKVVAIEVCTCQDKKCTQPNCTKKCVRLCFVRDFLTTYPCTNSSGNYSVHVDIMCNGKAQCPKREDEENCQDDICRNHHLMVLRRKLHLELEKFKYTALEGGLEAWQEKAIKRISSVEKLDHISPLAYKMLIQDILRDLAETYASNENLEESKMVSNERILNKYHELGVHIMELAKACTR